MLRRAGQDTPMFRALFLALFVLANAAPFAPSRLDDPEVKAYHHIVQETLANRDSCSATAIGPHALLTATHCELGSDELQIDGLSAHISKKLRDGNDHTIYIFSDTTFPTYLPVSERVPR